MRVGRDMGIVSHRVVAEYKKVMNGEDDTKVKCTKCKGKGYLRDSVNDKFDNCPRCEGWGFYKKV